MNKIKCNLLPLRSHIQDVTLCQSCEPVWITASGPLPVRRYSCWKTMFIHTGVHTVTLNPNHSLSLLRKHPQTQSYDNERWKKLCSVILPCVWSSQLQRGWTTHHIGATESKSRHCNLHQARPSCLCLSQSSYARLRAGTPPDWTQSAASALL